MIDGGGTTVYSYDQEGQLSSEDGLWLDDTVNYRRFMYTESAPALTKSVAFICVIALCLVVSSDLPSNATPNELPNVNSSANISPFYRSINDVDLFFKTNKIPAEGQEIKNQSMDYYFVMAHPYSGMDTTDLYCFVKRGRGWAMFLKAFLWKAPFAGDVKFKVDGEFVNVICKDKVVLKVNPQK